VKPVGGTVPVGETDWRRVAKEIRGHLREIFRDSAEAVAVDEEIRALLAEPDGPATQRRLRNALLRREATRAWVRQALDRSASGFRTGEQDADDPFRAGRYLAAKVPGRVPLGARFSVEVKILLNLPPSPHKLLWLPARPGPRTVTVAVKAAPALQPIGHRRHELTVPPEADSDPVSFGFVAHRPGSHELVVQAYHGGTFLGELVTSISAEDDVTSADEHTARATLGSIHGRAGEVTLLVHKIDGQYYFQLLGGPAWENLEDTRRAVGDMDSAVKALHRQLRDMAGNPGLYGSLAQARRGMANRGAALWLNAVPEAIRRQFWAQVDNIKSFVVACDDDIVPWELLYAVEGNNNLGFLAERFPVTRRLFGQIAARTLRLRSAAYVMPPTSPSDARKEIDQVRRRLGLGVRDGGVIEEVGHLQDLVENGAAPSVLHFACHNTFLENSGSTVQMGGGPFRPEDLSIAVASRSLATVGTLVFFNACRSAGQIPFFGGTMGWAHQFVRAGAGAFIGTHWPVRSASARAFADAFYQALVEGEGPQTLGAAALTARQSVAQDLGDPTWLAYAVYGDADATAAR
jgi:hypothetical protein